MPLSTSSSPRVDVTIDMGNPLLNVTVDGFLKTGTVAAAKVAVEEAYHVITKGNKASTVLNKLDLENDVYELAFEHDRMSVACLNRESRVTIPKLILQFITITKELKKMCKEGAYWGTVGGVYVGMEYGVGKIRGTRDWKNAMIGGALTGAVISAAINKNRDNIVMDAITGGAVATAAEFISYLT
ncbi:hypothetical protein BUALT_Bualt02G0062800 [Buddleja alternifolia]|uniref:Outer envelope pore protein 16, chloroplastic n=1 Tax=Buddleja alternifolia TaxID=168488 RepID=A0AAV6XYF1_9LAMI|nr:hypothetical protein BUALT_Bualt02G0062800 [Buddleja alternifolia]